MAACLLSCEEMCDNEEACTAVEIFMQGEDNDIDERYCAMHFDGEMKTRPPASDDETHICYTKNIHDDKGHELSDKTNPYARTDDKDKGASKLQAISVALTAALAMLYQI